MWLMNPFTSLLLVASAVYPDSADQHPAYCGGHGPAAGAGDDPVLASGEGETREQSHRRAYHSSLSHKDIGPPLRGVGAFGGAGTDSHEGGRGGSPRGRPGGRPPAYAVCESVIDGIIHPMLNCQEKSRGDRQSLSRRAPRPAPAADARPDTARQLPRGSAPAGGPVRDVSGAGFSAEVSVRDRGSKKRRAASLPEQQQI